jgi:hypothetical protein
MSRYAVSLPLPFLQDLFKISTMWGQSNILRSDAIRGKNLWLMIQYGSETAVASGAVLRALNRADGPTRVIQSSYGFLRNEPWAPDRIDAHRHSNPQRADPNDGDRYVKNTIYWVVKKVSPPL